MRYDRLPDDRRNVEDMAQAVLQHDVWAFRRGFHECLANELAALDGLDCRSCTALLQAIDELAMAGVASVLRLQGATPDPPGDEDNRNEWLAHMAQVAHLGVAANRIRARRRDAVAEAITAVSNGGESGVFFDA